MAAEDAQYLADMGVTHLLNTASGDNQPDGVKLKHHSWTLDFFDQTE